MLLSTFLRPLEHTLCEKCPNTEFFLFRIFPYSNWIWRDTPHFSVFSPNAGKYGPEKTPYLDTFHAVITLLCFICSYTYHYIKKKIKKKKKKRYSFFPSLHISCSTIHTHTRTHAHTQYCWYLHFFIIFGILIAYVDSEKFMFHSYFERKNDKVLIFNVHFSNFEISVSL